MERTQFSASKVHASLRRAYFLLATLAIGFTVLIMQALNPWFAPNRIQIIKKQRVNRGVTEYYYNDFDHDGFSEYLIFKNVPEWNEIGVKYYTSKGMLIDQWNFSEKWLRNSIFFADFDNDSHDEVYFFTKGKDSLFLYSFDPRYPNRFFIYRTFIVRAPKVNPHPQKIWDVYGIEAVFYDSDGDGFKEMFFSIMTGHSLQPRRLYKFDIKHQRIVAKSPLMGAYLGGLKLLDLDGDKNPELIFHFASSPYNYPDNAIAYPDNQSWLMVFNLDLQFKFKPISFSPAFSHNINVFWKHKEQNYIAVCKGYFGKLDVQPALLLYTTQGKLLRKRKLNGKIVWFLFSIPQDTHKHLYLCNLSNNKLTELSPELKPITTIELPHGIGRILKQMDFDNDLQDELLATGPDGYLIVEPNFKQITVLPDIPTNEGSVMLSVCKRGKEPADLIFQTESFLYTMRYSNNPWYWMRFPAGTGLAIILFIIFGGLFVQYQHHSSTHQMHKQLFRFSQVGYLLLDFKGRIRQVNGRFEHVLKLSTHLQEGVSFTDGLQERPELVAFIQNLMDGQTLLEKEFNFSQTSVLTRGFVQPGALGVPAGYVIEVKPSGNEHVDQKIQVWSKTVQKMAHDIKTPLSAIHLSLQTLQMKINDLYPEANILEEDFRLILQELNRVRQMTRHFLKFTNLEKPKLQLISLKEIVERAISRFSRYFNGQIAIQLELDEKYDSLWADALQLEMVFQIIIENAIDAMQGKGMILITSTLAQYLDRQFQSFVEIDIADTGPGIAKDVQERVFEPYFTTKSEGTGMGLTIARKIIEDHGGEITIVSRSGFATVLRIMLPYGNIQGENGA